MYPTISMAAMFSMASMFLLLGVATECIALNATEEQRELIFREDWSETPAETPITQNHVNNKELVLSRHGPDADSIKKSHHDHIPNDPWYVWSGSCEQGRWAISLKKKRALIDLTSNGLIRLRAKQSGAHVLKIILELEDGIWLVSDKGFGKTDDWHVFDAEIEKMRWRCLDIQTIKAGEIIKLPDLRRVRSVGWTDLMTGHGSEGCTRVDWIEVYGHADSKNSPPEETPNLPSKAIDVP